MQLLKVTKETVYNDLVTPAERDVERIRNNRNNNEYESGNLWDAICVLGSMQDMYDHITAPKKARIQYTDDGYESYHDICLDVI